MIVPHYLHLYKHDSFFPWRSVIYDVDECLKPLKIINKQKTKGSPFPQKTSHPVDLVPEVTILRAQC